MTTSQHSFLWRIISLLCIFVLLPSSSSPPGASENRYQPSPEDQELVRQVEAWFDHDRDAVRGKILRQWFTQREESFAMFRDLQHDAVTAEVLSELPFGRLIRRAAKESHVDPLLLAAMVEVESGFNPRAVSYRGAVGLLQVMPTTAGPASLGRLHHPEHNLRTGARYFQRLMKRFDGDTVIALAAYNAGPGNVRRYKGVPPFRETQGYIDKVLERYIDHLRGLQHAERMIDLNASVDLKPVDLEPTDLKPVDLKPELFKPMNFMEEIVGAEALTRT